MSWIETSYLELLTTGRKGEGRSANVSCFRKGLSGTLERQTFPCVKLSALELALYAITSAIIHGNSSCSSWSKQREEKKQQRARKEPLFYCNRSAGDPITSTACLQHSINPETVGSCFDVAETWRPFEDLVHKLFCRPGSHPETLMLSK